MGATAASMSTASLPSSPPLPHPTITESQGPSPWAFDQALHKAKIPTKLDGDNIVAWRQDVLDKLGALGADQILTLDPPHAADPTYGHYTKLNMAVRLLLRASVVDAIRVHVNTITHSRDLFAHLCDISHGHKEAQATKLLEEIASASYDGSTSLQAYVQQVSTKYYRLRDLSPSHTSEKSFVYLLLSGIEKWAHPPSQMIIVAMKRDPNLQLVMVICELRQQPWWLSAPESAIAQIALSAQSTSVAKCIHCGKTGKHGLAPETCRSLQRSQPNKKRPAMNRTARKWKRKYQALSARLTTNDRDEKRSKSDESDEDAIILMAQLPQTQAAGRSTNQWFLDSGATRHVTGKRRLFATYIPASSKRFIETAGGHRCEILGSGDVILTTILPSGTQKRIRLTEVLHVDGAEHNLIAVRVLAKRGFSVTFGDKSAWCRSSDGTPILTAHLKSDLYVVRS